MRLAIPILLTLTALGLHAGTHEGVVKRHPHAAESRKPHESTKRHPHEAASHSKPQKPPKHETATHQKPPKPPKH